MAKTKAELQAEAANLGVEVDAKATVAQLTAQIAAAQNSNYNEITPTDAISASGPEGDADGNHQERSETGNQEENREEVAQANEADSHKAATTAKAGKRSAKGLADAEAKAEKIEQQKHRAEDEAEAESAARQPITPTRSRLERRSKAYRQAAGQIDKAKTYSLAEALELATKTSPVKFDASVELHVRLGVDPRQADQIIRASLVLPQGTGKKVRVAVFADDKAENADVSGVEEIIKQLEKGDINFDILIATPANMPRLGKYARLLGPRGLMPNPKSGTVTTDVTKAVAEAKAGRVEYRVDGTGIVHVAVGKVSFGGARLLENAAAVMASIKAAKPASVKGTYIRSMFVASTMGPSISVNPNE